MALPFRDRVAQWWVYSLLYPIFDKTFIEDSYACRRGKGQKAAADRLQDMIKQTEVLGGKWYYLTFRRRSPVYGSFYSWYRGRPNYRRCRG